MRLASLRDGSRDGRLIVVSSAGERFLPAAKIAASLREALDNWSRLEPHLRGLAWKLESDAHAGEPLDIRRLGPPLARANEWIDGSAYLSHVERVRRARGATMPADATTEALVYQGGSSVLAGPFDPTPTYGDHSGLDFEGELGVIVDDVPRQCSAAKAWSYVRLLVMINDVTLRNLVPAELAKGFGFFCSKPATAFAPFAITPDEIGNAVHAGRIHLRMRIERNGKVVGDLPTGTGMHFSFNDLIQHITQTRALGAGTIIGAGTVSSSNINDGVACIAEARALETIADGTPRTPWLSAGESLSLRVFDDNHRDIFGPIETVVQP